MVNLFGSLNWFVGALAGYFIEDYKWPRSSTRLVRMEDVIFRLHGHMARVSAI
jgi:hypothetical protein